jgi:hypothetical protein
MVLLVQANNEAFTTLITSFADNATNSQSLVAATDSFMPIVEHIPRTSFIINENLDHFDSRAFNRVRIAADFGLRTRRLYPWLGWGEHADPLIALAGRVN